MPRKLALSAAFVALALCSVDVSAQTKLAVARYPFAELRDSLLYGVSLTDSQKVKVEAIARGYWEVMHANDARMRGAPRDSVRAFVRELGERQVADLRRVLTPTQAITFDKNLKLSPKSP